MVGSRTLTAVVGIAASLAVSALVYWYTGSLLLFLVVPFVPFLFRAGGAAPVERPPPKECPRCGFRTRDPEFEHCPRDGERLRTTRTD